MLKDAPTQQARNASRASFISEGDAAKSVGLPPEGFGVINALVKKGKTAHPARHVAGEAQLRALVCADWASSGPRGKVDGCAKLLDESTVVPEDADGLFRGRSPATVQAKHCTTRPGRRRRLPWMSARGRGSSAPPTTLPDEPCRAEYERHIGTDFCKAGAELSERLDGVELELVERSRTRAALRRRGASQESTTTAARSSPTRYPRRKRKQKPSAATRPALQTPIRRPYALKELRSRSPTSTVFQCLATGRVRISCARSGGVAGWGSARVGRKGLGWDCTAAAARRRTRSCKARWRSANWPFPRILSPKPTEALASIGHAGGSRPAGQEG